MAESAVATPLTGENLAPQGVRDAITTPQQIEQHIAQASSTLNSGRIRELLRSRFTRMVQLAELADLVPRQLHHYPKDPMNGLIAKGFIQQVKIYASSQGECTQAITEFKELLGKVQQDVNRDTYMRWENRRTYGCQRGKSLLTVCRRETWI
jgi:hypothetical protein